MKISTESKLNGSTEIQGLAVGRYAATVSNTGNITTMTFNSDDNTIAATNRAQLLDDFKAFVEYVSSSADSQANVYKLQTDSKASEE